MTVPPPGGNNNFCFTSWYQWLSVSFIEVTFLKQNDPETLNRITDCVHSPTNPVLLLLIHCANRLPRWMLLQHWRWSRPDCWLLHLGQIHHPSDWLKIKTYIIVEWTVFYREGMYWHAHWSPLGGAKPPGREPPPPLPHCGVNDPLLTPTTITIMSRIIWTQVFNQSVFRGIL